MPGAKRSQARIRGEQDAVATAVELGRKTRTARLRRKLTQDALSARVGISRSRLADLERGDGASAPLASWCVLAKALDVGLRVEFARDPHEQTADADHLAIQELVLRLGRSAGLEGVFELPTRANDPARSIDVCLLDRRGRRLVVIECWNTFGDVGAASRSSDRKRAETHALAGGMGWTDGSYEMGSCWIVRASRRNRDLVARYPHIFETRFPASSQVWLRVLTVGGRIPSAAGLVWCDVRATRLFAHRRVSPRSGVSGGVSV